MTARGRRPARSFFGHPTLEVARRLLGMRLIRCSGGRRSAGLIVETEAYIGEEDRACHAAAGQTARNAVMYGPPGHAYVYFVYGMHYCLNVVTEPDRYPAAVLIRAVEPEEGLAEMAERRRLADALGAELGRLSDSQLAAARRHPGRVLRSLCSGPGRLCQAFGIDRTLNGTSLLGGDLFLERVAAPSPPILATPRVGVDYAGPWRHKPWRFLVADSPWVSGSRRPARSSTGS
jgi:DNA-3-methyladenine glycosylase